MLLDKQRKVMLFVNSNDGLPIERKKRGGKIIMKWKQREINKEQALKNVQICIEFYAKVCYNINKRLVDV